MECGWAAALLFLRIKPEKRSLYISQIKISLLASNLGLPLSNKNSLLAVENLHKRLAERDALCESPVIAREQAKEAGCARRNLI